MSNFSANIDAKEQVKRAINIVDLIGDYLPLRREGRNYKGLCPWHNDSRPSLHVNQERQSFKCFVCNIGGDIFSFVMKQEGVEFREALEMLAQRAGIPLQTRHAAPGAVDEKQVLYQAMAWAEQEYHRCLLQAPEAEQARKYLAERGISSESIARYRLGFSPDINQWLVQRARGTPHALQALEKVDLVSRSEYGPGHYDRFRGRVLFSIRDAQGRPVGIGGRVLPGLENPRVGKYVNSRETPLFSKSHMLYGLDVARDSISKSRTVLVMEGYTDCIMAQQQGIDNAVAVLGTALGERHVQLLKRYCDRVILVLDGDEAGQRRTNEVLNLFVAEQVDLQILTLPNELDPCDFLHQQGADAFRALLTNTVDALEHKFRTVTAAVGTADNVHAANKATEEILATLAQSPKLQTGAPTALRVKEDQILHRTARRFGVPEETLRARLKELRRSQRSRPSHASRESEPAAPTIADGPLPALEKLLLEAFLLAPQGLQEFVAQISPEQLQSARARIIMRKSCELAARQIEPTFERLMLEFEDNEIKSLLVELDEEARAKPVADPLAYLRELLLKVQHERQAREGRTHQAAMSEHRLDSAQELQIYWKRLEEEKRRQGIPPTDG